MNQTSELFLNYELFKQCHLSYGDLCFGEMKSETNNGFFGIHGNFRFCNSSQFYASLVWFMPQMFLTKLVVSWDESV